MGNAAHPRSRGEHGNSPEMPARRPGSSPLARGTRARTNHLWSRDRLIPARAGNTLVPQESPTPFSAHPRSRGEHRPSLTARPPPAGSSPLARGTPESHRGGGVGAGLIPARAGNTIWLWIWQLWLAAHPRSRGEHRVAASDAETATGSSPLARGTLR